ncbi:MAG: hypothetical protein ACXAEN_21105 [Candidatus Thorarchaeota archaeon]|jgi:hypothetical protein
MTDIEYKTATGYFQRIIDFLKRGKDDEISYYDLFITREGENYSDRVHELDTFVFKGSLFSIPFGEFMSRMKRMIADGELRRAISDDVIDIDGEKMLDCLELFLKSEPKDDEDSLEQLFSKEEIPHLLATLTFSLYTYLEAYSTDLVGQLEESKELSHQAVEKLQQWYEEHPDKGQLRHVEKIGDLRIRGLERRLRRLVVGLDLEPILDEIFGEKHVFYKELFEYFTEMRHKLAHSNPAPSTECYQHPFFQDRLVRFKREMLATIEAADDRSPQLDKLLEPILTRFEEMIEPLSWIAAMSEIATVYPAMIDAGVGMRLEL